MPTTARAHGPSRRAPGRRYAGPEPREPAQQSRRPRSPRAEARARRARRPPRQRSRPARCPQPSQTPARPVPALPRGRPVRRPLPPPGLPRRDPGRRGRAGGARRPERHGSAAGRPVRNRRPRRPRRSASSPRARGRPTLADALVARVGADSPASAASAAVRAPGAPPPARRRRAAATRQDPACARARAGPRPAAPYGCTRPRARQWAAPLTGRHAPVDLLRSTRSTRRGRRPARRGFRSDDGPRRRHAGPPAPAASWPHGAPGAGRRRPRRHGPAGAARATLGRRPSPAAPPRPLPAPAAGAPGAASAPPRRRPRGCASPAPRRCPPATSSTPSPRTSSGSSTRRRAAMASTSDPGAGPMRPMIDDLELPQVQEVETSDRRRARRASGPRAGRQPAAGSRPRATRILVYGVASGPDARDFMSKLDDKFRAACPSRSRRTSSPTRRSTRS